AETCECPMAGDLAVVVCDAATAIPSLAPDCARCTGCLVDLSPCATPTTSSTSTTAPGPATTTTTSFSSSTTSTSTTVPRPTTTPPATCDIAPTFASIDCRLIALLGQIDGESDLVGFRPKLVQDLSRARDNEEAARSACASSDPKRGGRRLKGTIRAMIQYAR